MFLKKSGSSWHEHFPQIQQKHLVKTLAEWVLRFVGVMCSLTNFPVSNLAVTEQSMRN